MQESDIQTGAEGAGVETPTTDPAPESLEAKLAAAEQKAAEHQDAYLRSRAEADNIRKRAQADVAAAHKFAVEGFASALVPVKDSLEAALASETPSVENLKNGVELTLKQLKSAFDKFSLKEIDPAGQKFDPHQHQAISMVPSDAEANTVVQVLQKGYLLHDRVIRPALVTVSQGKPVES